MYPASGGTIVCIPVPSGFTATIKPVPLSIFIAAIATKIREVKAALGVNGDY
jgi:hypothetical protein